MEWGKCLEDGGSAVTGYVLEYSLAESDKWTKITKVGEFVQYYVVTNLEQDQSYFFSVSTENEVGVSHRLKTEGPIKTKKPMSKFISNFIKF